MTRQLKIISFLSLFVCASSVFAQPHGGPMPPPAVSIIELQKSPVTLKMQLSGRVVATGESQVRPQVDGLVTKRLYKEGSFVKKGQPLYQIDPAPYLAEVEKARAELTSAKAALRLFKAKNKRFNKLVKAHAVSEQEHEDIAAEFAQANADVSRAEAQLRAATINLHFTTIKAPISGFIGRSTVTKGALVTRNQSAPLAQITRLDPIYVDLMQTTSEASAIRKALRLKGTLPITLLLPDSDKEYQHPGELSFSEVTVDKNNGAVSLRAHFPNPEQVLLPGMFVRATVNFETVDGMLIPQQAVIHGQGGKAVVWTLEKDDTVQMKPVKPMKAIGDKWLILEGIDNGTKIVFEGFQKIRPGAKVKPEPVTPPLIPN